MSGPREIWDLSVALADSGHLGRLQGDGGVTSVRWKCHKDLCVSSYLTFKSPSCHFTKQDPQCTVLTHTLSEEELTAETDLSLSPILTCLDLHWFYLPVAPLFHRSWMINMILNHVLLMLLRCHEYFLYNCVVTIRYCDSPKCISIRRDERLTQASVHVGEV